ncbi:probable LRR receptor-like serine/threonine-protein kinase RFK1 isoform X1 [Populus alba]|uniref:probable LRR receptor-like serine/threonine-protein kinase RFK1 isoform X1 n=1 Tax=Populus alba TaxID=43335 RepID=UPI00158CEC38|nr:probable LRR receptor-like serine/threonine-protein kinase RFK1 isoform X2 [Populus alba]
MTMKFSSSVQKNPDKNRLYNLLSIFWVVQMSFSLRYAFLISVLTFICLETPRLAAARLPQDEVDALNLITKKLGANGWNFNADSCGENLPHVQLMDPDKNVTCDCEFANNTCHITSLKFKRFSLAGELPPELVQLPYLESIDLSYNELGGSIPSEWASLQLKKIALLANRLSGNIPRYLGSFTSLAYLDLELNQFSGMIPRELGKLVNLETLILSSNKLDGNLPKELAELKNLTDFRINDNNFNGSIPDFVQNWKQLKRLELVASGLEGPIPSSISALKTLTDLRITDINFTNQSFPDLSNIVGLSRLLLRNCNISGEIPPYIWEMSELRVLDLSFNKLHGNLPNAITTETLVFIFLSGNLLTGNIPMFRKGMSVDLSYNNFSQQSSGKPACQQGMDVTLNLFRSSSMGKDIGGACMDDLTCNKYWHSMYINCGGQNVKTNGSTFEGDAAASSGAAIFYQSEDEWGISSTGDFMDDNDFQNRAYIENMSSLNINELYQTARVSPISLTYYHRCLENGNYTVSLHFAEIRLKNDNTYNSLGRRLFDVYIQNNLAEKDFNIEVEAAGVAKPVTKTHNASVTNNILDIRLYWAGKGTTRIPVSGVYGPLISAISVYPNFKPRFSGGGKTRTVPIILGVVGFCLVFSALAIFWWKCYFRVKKKRQKGLEGIEIQTVSFTLKQIKAATGNFDPANKIGEGGFGPVYKGMLPDGTVIAVKQLSSKSSQGNREFLNEIGVISCMQHPHLVKLHGCCIEGDQLLLVYEYMENNSLSRALFGPENQLHLDWKTRQKICIGIAKGLSFLHEESRLKIVHRDIKVTNVLLDKDLNPKISDFGLAKLDEREKTYISTRVAGTVGYMAPEYALWGRLTYKADVYSFGIVALEIVSGKHNKSCGPDDQFSCLLDWACHLEQNGNLMELVDQKLGSEFNKVEAERLIKVALLCANASPSLRPIMSEVVSMIEGTRIIPDVIPEPHSEDLRFKAIRGQHERIRSSLRGNQNSSSILDRLDNNSSHVHTDDDDPYETDEELNARFDTRSKHYKQPDSRSEVSTLSETAVSSTCVHDPFDINISS